MFQTLDRNEETISTRVCNGCQRYVALIQPSATKCLPTSASSCMAVAHSQQVIASIFKRLPPCRIYPKAPTQPSTPQSGAGATHSQNNCLLRTIFSLGNNNEQPIWLSSKHRDWPPPSGSNSYTLKQKTPFHSCVSQLKTKKCLHLTEDEMLTPHRKLGYSRNERRETQEEVEGGCRRKLQRRRKAKEIACVMEKEKLVRLLNSR